MLKVPSQGHPTSKVGHSERQRVCHFLLLTSTDRLLARSLTSFQYSRVKLRGVVSLCPVVGGKGKQKYTKRLTKQTHETQTRSRAAQNRRQTERNNSDGSGDKVSLPLQEDGLLVPSHPSPLERPPGLKFGSPWTRQSSSQISTEPVRVPKQSIDRQQIP